MHKLTEEGKNTLRQVASWAARHHTQFDMDTVFDEVGEFPLERNECGTAACLAGWTAHETLTPEQRRAVVDVNNSVDIMMAIAVLKLSGQYDKELHILFNLVFDINSDNVVKAVETFIEGGIEAVYQLLNIDPWKCGDVSSWANYLMPSMPVAERIINMQNAQVN